MTNRKTALAATKTTPGLSSLHRPNKHCGPLAAVILLLGALQLQVFVPTVLAESSTEVNSGGARPWSVQVDRVDPGDVGLDPSFGAAIYENLLEELAKTEQFKQVFRSGDRNANDVPGLLILKTTVQKYTPGSETRRAVTTVSGATKLNVRVQLVTREGQVVQEHVIDGNVRFIGGKPASNPQLGTQCGSYFEKATPNGADRRTPRKGDRKYVQVKPGAYDREIPSHPNRLEPGEGNRNSAEEKAT